MPGPDRTAPATPAHLNRSATAGIVLAIRDAWCAGWRQGWDDAMADRENDAVLADVLVWAEANLTAEQRWELAGALMLALVAERRPTAEER